MIGFGDRLKNLRLSNGLSQAQLAQKVGVSKSLISAYENGSRQPSYEVLIAFASLFSVSTDYLLGLEKGNELDLSSLSEEEVYALKGLIRAMKYHRFTQKEMFSD